jgi:excinuclease UvrABC nuclease subunit
MFGNLSKYFNFINNLKYYFNFLLEDKEDDFIYINKLLLLKLKKVEKYWGTNTNYVGDYDDKEKLRELIIQLEETIDFQTLSEDERENKKRNFKIYGKLGNFLPKLWN